MDEQELPFNVVNDHALQLWKHLDCQLWPTALVFGPDALPLYIFEGDNHVQHLETFLAPVINFYKSSVRAASSTATLSSPEDIATGAKGTSNDCIDDESTAIDSLPAQKPAKFAYPSHICVTNNGQLCISYSGSNQLVHCEIDGKVIVSRSLEWK